MTTKLQNVLVKEIALVSRGANAKRIFLTKSLEEQEEQEEPVADTKTPEAIALEKAQTDLAAVQAQVIELQKAQAEAKTASDALVAAKEAVEKALAAEKETAEVADSVRKAADNYKNLPEKPEVLGPVLRQIRKIDAKSADTLESLLKKVDEIAKQALNPKGSSSAEDKPDSAIAEITKRANGLVSAKVVTTFAKAFDRVLQDDKTLYAKYESEKAKV